MDFKYKKIMFASVFIFTVFYIFGYEKGFVFTNGLRIRDTPSTNGRVIGSCNENIYLDINGQRIILYRNKVIHIYKAEGSMTMNNGTWDYWYKISEAGEYWINAYYVATFPILLSDSFTDNYKIMDINENNMTTYFIYSENNIKREINFTFYEKLTKELLDDPRYRVSELIKNINSQITAETEYEFYPKPRYNDGKEYKVLDMKLLYGLNNVSKLGDIEQILGPQSMGRISIARFEINDFNFQYYLTVIYEISEGIIMEMAYWIRPIAFSQSNNYANGNGTIIEIKTEGNIKWIFRKHVQSVEIGDLSREENLTIYDKPSLEKGSIVGKLKLNDNITIAQVAEVIMENECHYWVNITTDNNINGWIFSGKYDYIYAMTSVPYFADRWEILEYITVGGKSWTIRKMIQQSLSIPTVVNIRDKPGLVDTKIISKIIPEIIPPENNPRLIFVDITEATEEMETIDGRTDRWLKINYHGVEGWIFGGYADVERGGPKYRTPESSIYYGLGWY
jgi:hypothetical protein